MSAQIKTIESQLSLLEDKVKSFRVTINKSAEQVRKIENTLCRLQVTISYAYCIPGHDKSTTYWIAWNKHGKVKKRWRLLFWRYELQKTGEMQLVSEKPLANEDHSSLMGCAEFLPHFIEGLGAKIEQERREIEESASSMSSTQRMI